MQGTSLDVNTSSKSHAFEDAAPLVNTCLKLTAPQKFAQWYATRTASGFAVSCQILGQSIKVLVWEENTK